MNIKTETRRQRIARSFASGVLLSMLCFYCIHVMGTWEIENYRPNSQTTYTVLLHNTCAILGDLHTLRPNTNISPMEDGINGTKLSGSFMNFTDGHIVAMLTFAILSGIVAFAIRSSIKQNLQQKQVL